LPVVSLEETADGEEDSPKRDVGAEDLRLAGAIDRVELNRAVEDLPPGYRSVLFCMMWKALSTPRLRTWWVVRSATASHSCTRPE